jgi:quercetin dioxygenase-like cupin family protein
MHLVLLEDTLEREAALFAGAFNRVVYCVGGWVDVACDGVTTTLGENQAWHGRGEVTVRATTDARLWRWELRPRSATANASGTVKLSRELTLGAGEYLMRGDRVDFPPGGIAYTHTHQGPGIRILLTGRFRVDTGGQSLAIAPGEAWFESGPEPVYAEGSPEEPTSFVRVMILPRALLGKSSIRYVKPEDQARPKSQSYTVFVDAPISL